MDPDIEFRIRAAAKVLERAANRTSDPKIREILLEKVKELRSMLSEPERTITIERNRTIEEVMEEIREFIWRDAKPRTEKPSQYTLEYLDPLDALEKRINEIIDSFEKKLMGILP